MSAWVAASMMATGQDGAPMVAIHDTPSFYTGDDLLDHHRSSPPQSPNGAVCRAYIIGVADMYRASRTGRNHPVCVPLSVSQGEVQRVVVAWLRSHPLLRKGPTAFALRHALIDTWPECATNR